MSRRPIVAANWKMNGTLRQAETLVRELLPLLKGPSFHLEVVLCPPFTALGAVAEWIRGTPLALGAQNIHWETHGAYTGEISGSMLKELGCRWALIGHSERRQLFSEIDAMVQKKVRAALAQDLQVILCVGETFAERQSGKTWAVVESQLQADLEGLSSEFVAERLVIAYEPVWAIGTGLNATAPQAQEVHASIRKWLLHRLGAAAASQIRIQYGGSVKPENAAELMGQPDIDGALVGGASLEAKSFGSIVEAAEKIKCTV